MMQKVSLYVPCFNVERFIQPCLEALMKQTHMPDEIIIVDDGSSDRTIEIVSQHPVKIVRHGKNRGLGAARNTGIRASAHGLVASLDADCVANPNWLKNLLAYLEDDRVAGVGGMLIERNTVKLPDRWRMLHMRQHWGDTRQVNPPFLFGNNNLFKKAVLEEAGLYNEKLTTNFEDVAMSHAIARLGYRLVYEPSATVEHLRTDTLSSVIRANWKWRFFGYQHDVNLNNTIKGIKYHIDPELRYFLALDYRRRDFSCAVLSLAATGYAIFTDLKYLLEHRGERAIQDM
jgi:GT2 family glycosyltransferase